MFSLTTLVGIYKHYIDTYNTNFSYISILALLIHIEIGAYIDFIVFVKHHKTCILGVSYSWSKLINKIKLYVRQFTNSHTQQYKKFTYTPNCVAYTEYTPTLRYAYRDFYLLIKMHVLY